MPFTPGLDESEAVVARVEMKEIGFERPHEIIAEPEAQHVGIERQHRVDPLRGEHGVPHAERTGAKAGNRASGPEWVGGNFGAVKGLETVADRIGKHDQIGDAALIRQRARAARHSHAVGFQMRRQRIERSSICNFPAVERRAEA